MDHALASPPRTSAAAVWSLVLGILSMFCLWLLGSIPAIILGIVALTRINAQPTLVGGRGIAIGGIVTGSIGILTGLVAVGIVASISMPAYNGIQERGKRIKEISEVRMLVLGCMNYAEANDGNYPDSLQELYPEYLDTKELFEPWGNLSSKVDYYSYRPGLTNRSPIEPLVIGPEHTIKRVVGYTDGTVAEIETPLPPEVLSEFE